MILPKQQLEISSVLVYVWTAVLLLFPNVSLAQPTTYSLLVGEIINIVSILIPLIFAVVFLYLVWKIIDAWILNAGDEAKRSEGKQYALTAILMLVLMVSTWGIIRLLKNTFFPEA